MLFLGSGFCFVRPRTEILFGLCIQVPEEQDKMITKTLPTFFMRNRYGRVLMYVFLLIAVAIPAGAALADPLPSWNEGPAKRPLFNLCAP